MCVGAQVPEQWFTRPLLPEPARRAQMYAYVNAHIPPLPRFQTLAQWEAYRKPLKDRILRLLGVDDILAAHKLNLRRVGTLSRDGYTIEKIQYESYPGMFVPALVWAPKKVSGKAPAMVSISGHSYCDSKAADYVQARNYNLVRRGFIVVSYDYLGCFERGRLDACQKGVFGGTDHTNSLFSYTRRTPTAIELLDGIRAVDYLYSRPDVDRARIGFTGESGGGNNTYWVSALDERVTLSVPVSAAGAFEQWIKADLNYDWHQRPPGFRAFADIGTLYAMVAPRPLLVVNGHPELSEFALPDALRSVDYAGHVYQLYGKAGHIRFHESHTGHGYQPDKRVELYRWLNRWFFDGKMPHGDRDLPYTAEPKENLRVGLPDGNPTLPVLAERWVKEALQETPLPQTAAEARRFQASKRVELKALLGREAPVRNPGVLYQYDMDQEQGGYQAELLRIEVDRDLLLPAVFVRKPGRARYPAVILLEKKRGTSPEAQALLDRGHALLLLDVRGTGEVDWGGGRTSNWANFTGRPPAGMWAEDISAAATWLLARKDVENVSVVGYGVFGKAALYAAALDERIAAAALTTDTVSYRAEATSGLAHVYADVPRILAWGDTAQLAALAAPRRLAILGAGVPLSLNQERPTYFSPLPRFEVGTERVADEALRASYEWTRRFYRLLGVEGRFRAGREKDMAAEIVDWLAPVSPGRVPGATTSPDRSRTAR